MKPQNATQQAACTPPDSRGYLLYLAFAQQFNNQLLTVVENIKLAQKMGRVIVLTGFMEHKMDGSKTSDGHDYYDGDHELHDFSEYFEPYSTLGGFGMDEWTGEGQGDWISLEAFNQLCPSGLGKAEAHVFVPAWENPIPGGTLEKQVTDWQVVEHLYKCPQEGWPNPCGDAGWENDRSNPLLWVWPKFPNATLIAHDSNYVWDLATVPSGTDTPVIITDNLFFSYEHVTPTYLNGEPELMSSLHHFRWAQDIADRANSYYMSTFGGNNYIALHWRRGYTDGTVQIRTVDEAVQILRDVTNVNLNADGTKPDLYVASNIFTWDDAGMLEAMLGTGQKVHSLILDSPWDDDMNFLSHVEMSICSSARAFIRAEGSTWSYNVMSLRGETDGSGSGGEEGVSTTTDSAVSEEGSSDLAPGSQGSQGSQGSSAPASQSGGDAQTDATSKSAKESKEAKTAKKAGKAEAKADKAKAEAKGERKVEAKAEAKAVSKGEKKGASLSKAAKEKIKKVQQELSMVPILEQRAKLSSQFAAEAVAKKALLAAKAGKAVKAIKEVKQQ